MLRPRPRLCEMRSADLPYRNAGIQVSRPTGCRPLQVVVDVDVVAVVMPVQISLSEFRIWIRARRFFGGLCAMAVAERFGLN